MKTLKIMRYQLWDAKYGILTFYGIILAITSLLVLMNLNIMKQGNINVSMGGIDMASIIFIFVTGLVSFKSSFRFMQANSVSRIHFLKGHILSIFPIAGLMALIDIIINRASNLFIQNNSLFLQIYSKVEYGFQPNLNIFSNFAWSFSVLCFFGIIGFCISLIYYRSSKVLKIVISIMPFIIISALGYLNGLTNGTISNVISNFFNLIWGFKHGYNPYIAVLSMSIGFILFSFLSFLLIKRAPVKD